MPREDPGVGSTSIFRARTLSSSQATLVADGAKKVVFDYCKTGNQSASRAPRRAAAARALTATRTSS